MAGIAGMAREAGAVVEGVEALEELCWFAVLPARCVSPGTQTMNCGGHSVFASVARAGAMVTWW